MKKSKIQHIVLTSASVLFLLFSYVVILVPHTFAAQQLVCPTPTQKSPGSMQMSYCYVIDTDTHASTNGSNETGNGIYTSDGTAKTSNGCSQTCNPGEQCQQLCGANVSSNITTNSTSGISGLSGLGSLFSNLPILNFLLPAGQSASTTSSSSIGLQPLSQLTQLIGSSSNVQAKNNNVGTNIVTPNGSSTTTNTTSTTGTSGLESQKGTQTNASSGAGLTCQADSLEASACSCPSYQERDLLCADPRCAEDGGLALGGLGNLPGLPAGANCAFGPGTNPPAGKDLSCAMQCNSKPIIYLYPTHDTTVNVTVAMQGHVTVSDPRYEANGWQNIQAHPGGLFDYNGKTYHELYYESETIKAAAPKDGIYIPSSQLKPQLEVITTKLGLNAFEREEFIAYWVPQLQSLHAPYILFSVFDEAEKVKVDDVHISPTPDTFIGFLAYFKAAQTPEEIAPLRYPQVPARTGFTAVEWGGTIAE